MSKLPVIALVAAALLSGQVAAETVSPTDQRFVRESKVGQWKASKTLGLKVYNDKNENIGQITELLFDKQGQIEAVVIGVGGFLGVGKREIAVPLSEIKPPSQEKVKDASGSTPLETGKSENMSNNDQKRSKMEDIGTPPYAVLKMTSDDLKSAPEFKMVQ
jgi:sporulation protein YlmC with PRC-barrel domain